MDVSTQLTGPKNDPTITDWLTAYGYIGYLIGAMGIGTISLYLTMMRLNKDNLKDKGE